jgi:hypothetical protein
MQVPDTLDGKKVWRTSELRRMKPQEYEKYEADIDAARREGRLVIDT